MSTNVRLVVGCGYLGERVARLWRDEGARVVVLTRSQRRAEELRAQGYKPLVGDVTDPASLKLPAAETVLFAVGHDRAAGKSIETVYVDGLRNVLAALPAQPQRFIYVSSTGVYGQTEGEVVDEDSPCRPTREGGRACLAAEQLLQASSLQDRAIILRLAGIYGPGRIPRATDIRAGQPIAAPADGIINLIHVDDAARIVVAAEQISPPRRYVVSDGHPVERRAYYEELARLLNAPSPTFAPPSAEAHVTQRAGSDKRVSPARLFADLGVTLKYPSYREGLREEMTNARNDQ
jgi:nucleoside-diphosphate-sugar epimerase